MRFRVGVDVSWYLPGVKAYSPGGLLEQRDMGFDGHTQSRGLIEHCVRQCTLETPNIRFVSGSTVQGLLHSGGRVRGIRYRSGDDVPADLVVDAAGRGSHAPRWLADLGYAPPEETTIGVDFAYSSTRFRIPDVHVESETLMLCFAPPEFESTRGAIMGEVEGDTWHISLAGRFGDYPPDDEDGFLAFTESLHTSKPHDLIKDAERVADIARYRFPTSVQRHYERLESFPEGFVVIGDAICSFNPVYGQGMSAAALQVAGLRDLLAERAADGRALEGLAREFLPRAAEIIETPWALAAAQDLAHPKTTGERPTDMAQRGAYFAALNALSIEDPDVGLLLTEVFHLAKPMSALMEPPLLGRVLEKQRTLS